MRRFLAAMTMMSALTPVLAAAQEPAGLERALASDDRIARVAALEKAAGLPTVPPSLVDSIVSAMKADIDAVFTQQGARHKKVGESTPTTEIQIPVDLGDTSIARLRADPEKHYDGPFTLTTGIGLEDTYPLPLVYDRARYFSYELRQFAPDGRDQPDGHGLAFLDRDLGAGLTERIAGAADSGATHLIVQVRCRVRRLVRDIGYPHLRVEIQDYRTYDYKGKLWSPWTLDGVEAGFRALQHAKAVAAGGLADIVDSRRLLGSPMVDPIVRSRAAEILIETDLDPEGRAAVVAKVDANREPFRIEDVQVRTAALNARERVLSAFRQPPKVDAATARKKAEDARRAKADTALRMGKNLEDMGKIKAAVGYYEGVVKDHPGTPQAEQATARLAKLKP